MSAKIHQLIAGASNGDAITEFAFSLKKLFSRRNTESFIYAPGLNILKIHGKNILHSSLLFKNAARGDILLYHYSIGSEVTEIFKSFSFKKVLCYHNITPFEYFLPFSDGFASLLKEGREELKTLPSLTDYPVAVSDFNKKELTEMGFKNSQTLPLILDTEYLTTEPDKSVLKEMQKSRHNLLFVGRVVPNKKIEDLIETFAYYRLLQKDAKLYLVGASDVLPSYFNFLKKMICAFKLEDRIVFTGKVPLKALTAYYKGAQAFLCLSEHEGFCLPLTMTLPSW